METENQNQNVNAEQPITNFQRGKEYHYEKT